MQERTAAHRYLERSSQVDNLVIGKHIGIHALSGTLQSQFFDVVIRRPWLEIEPSLKGENQLRENRCAVLASQSLDTDIENGLLNFPLKTISPQTKAQ